MTDHTDFSRELKRDKIMRLWTDNVPVVEIARLTGSTPGSVRVTVSTNRRRLHLHKRRWEPRIKPELLAEAEREAARRGISIPELFTRIVGAVVGERMVNAVLDDMEAA